MNAEQAHSEVRSMMLHTMKELATLVSHPSVAFPGFVSEPLQAMADETMRVLREAGFEGVTLLDIPGGYPAVWAEVPAPEGAPTVLLYGHYDVQPADAEGQGWESDPWELTLREDGRYYGRGAADNKSSIVIHAGMMRLFGGKPPVGIKLLIEGEEETLSHLEDFVEEHPEFFRADAMVIADMGNIAVGRPVLTTSTRGDVACTIEVRTVDHSLHSGIFGGPAPDALVALVRILASLHDEHGNVRVPGLRSYEWQGADFPEDLFRSESGTLPGVELVGDGSLASRLWSKPSITVIGLDAPPTDNAINALVPSAKARLSMRIAPGEDADAAMLALISFLEDNVPWGVQATIEPVKATAPFKTPVGGPAMAAARWALEEAYGVEPSIVGSGGSIPLLETLADVAPKAEFVLWGAEDVSGSRIHGGNESVDAGEIERTIVAEALFLQRLAETS
jgi:acetylornithine deacetylase/succinyl-diaminopimelate desuccinylase-like protein